MRLLIEIAMDNAAFEDCDAAPECARILRGAANKILGAGNIEPGYGFKLMDVNGNSVGTAKVIGKKGGFHE